jgi:hypothetical protein
MRGVRCVKHILLLLVGFSLNAHAENRFSVRERQDGQQYLHKYRGRLGLSGGLTTLNAADNTIESVNHSIYLGASGDLNFDYFGADLDVYYGTASANRNSNSQLKEGGLSQFGVLTAGRVQYPVYVGRMKMTPKAGLGFGLMNLSLHEEAGPIVKLFSDQVSTGANVKGLYYFFGAEVSPWPFLIINADYSQSFTASAEVKAVAGILGSSSDSASFSRFRVGANVRVLPRTLVGAQFTERAIQTGLPKSLINNDLLSSPQRHFMVNLTFEIP